MKDPKPAAVRRRLEEAAMHLAKSYAAFVAAFPNAENTRQEVGKHYDVVLRFLLVAGEASGAAVRQAHLEATVNAVYHRRAFERKLKAIK